MMNTLLRLKLAQELELLPAEHLPDLYRLIHYFRLGLLAASPQQTNGLMNGDMGFPESVASDPADEAVERERAAFIALHPMLLATYPGEEVAIYGGQVVDHDKDGVALSSRIYQRFPHEFVWIAPVTDQPLEVRTVYSQ
jgi:hypothetical protein